MTVLAGRRVVTPGSLLQPGVVTLTAATITSVADEEAPDGVPMFDWLVPGFVDIHCHGGGGAEFAAGDPASVAAAAQAHLRHGTTAVLASLVSAAPDELLRQVRDLADRCDEQLIAGIHLEGPWLAPAYRGAHDSAALRDPEVAELDRLLAAGRGHVRMVTLAPELPGALPVIRTAVDRGVAVAIGHTNATYEQVAAAVAEGATVGTHVCNTMRPMRHRDPGPIAALTEDPRVTVELIADAVHLDPATLRLVTRATAGRIALVTDAMPAAGAGDGVYRLGPLEVLVVGGVARLADGTIAGSTLTMAAAVRHFVESGAGDVETAVRAATVYPARAVGLAAGTLEAGVGADLVGLADDLNVVAVWRAGEQVA